MESVTAPDPETIEELVAMMTANGNEANVAWFKAWLNNGGLDHLAEWRT